ncbi:hypothetical protein M378DRAFT_171732 [Amanita muscaria Koide BX008]|uniref:Uncharacterized protein n=1 Tax=Amanita muscaria (strain Koide BX008) TaxID=946122 RepID=A0A0C2W8I8_AMAMK|nr:hypothetical protein M378DRAFT_171732 [Amanita muscaria Koide BX008]
MEHSAGKVPFSAAAANETALPHPRTFDDAAELCFAHNKGLPGHRPSLFYPLRL